jgi:hypothetical protein
MEGLRKELLIKFRRGELSYGKALEPQALLEEQRRRHEEAGNIAAAFLVSIILLLLPAFLASLATSERREGGQEQNLPKVYWQEPETPLEFQIWNIEEIGSHHHYQDPAL